MVPNVGRIITVDESYRENVKMEETTLYNVTIVTINGNTYTLELVSDNQIDALYDKLFGREVGSWANFDGFLINLDEVESFKYNILMEDE